MRIQHPRATDAFDREPPSGVAVPTGSGSYETRSVDGGYVDVGEDNVAAAMDSLERVYDVEYDRDTGEVIGADAGDGSDDGGDEPPDEGASDGPDDDGGGDLEAWTNWNEDDWLSLGYQTRQDDVEDGLVDDHLEEIIEIETSQNVRDAAEQRLEDLRD